MNFLLKLALIGTVTLIISCGDSNNNPVPVKVWQGDESVGPNTEDPTQVVVLDVDADGNAVSVWAQQDTTFFNMHASRYLLSSGWETPVKIETDDTRGDATTTISPPDIVADAAGNVIAVWSYFDGSVWANRYDAVSGWGMPIQLDNNLESADRPQIAMDGSGNAMVVWRQNIGTPTFRYDVWANRYDAGNDSWDGPVLIENNDNGRANDPMVAMDSAGNAIVVWWHRDDAAGPRDDIWANRFVVGPGGGWQGEILIESDNNGDALDPRVKFDGSGNAVVVWVQFDAADSFDGIWANTYDSTQPWASSWGAAEVIDNEDLGDARVPYISMNSLGQAVVVWEQDGATVTNAWANVFIAGAGWGTAQKIEADNAGDASDPRVAMSENGTAVAVWSQSDGTRFNIVANQLISGNWGTAEIIESDDSGVLGAIDPQVDVDDNGNAIAVWNQYIGGSFLVRANYFR